MRKYILITGVIIILASVIYNFLASNDPEAYREEITRLRQEQDRFMRYSSESPFQESDTPFDSLTHYKPDLAFKINAAFEPPEEPAIVELGTNDGETEEYLIYGYANFSINGKAQRLTILEDVREEKLFIPFGDETSAIETYGAGRYLDIEHHGGQTIILDFNLAYNPYCAYVDEYTCPLPPVENLLSVAIEAGEKTYHH